MSNVNWLKDDLSRFLLLPQHENKEMKTSYSIMYALLFKVVHKYVFIRYHHITTSKS